MFWYYGLLVIRFDYFIYVYVCMYVNINVDRCSIALTVVVADL